MPFVFPKRDIGRVILYHRFLIQYQQQFNFFILSLSTLINLLSPNSPMPPYTHSHKCNKCSAFDGDIRDCLLVIVIHIQNDQYLCHDCLQSTLQKQQHQSKRIQEQFICSKEFQSSVSDSELKIYVQNKEEDLNATLISEIQLLQQEYNSVSKSLLETVEECNQLRQRVYVAEEDEEKFWESVNRLQKKTFKLQQKSLRAKNEKQNLRDNLATLTETSIVHIFFNIQIQDNYSQICGLMIGKKPDQNQINWEQTNAGISHLLLGYNYLTMKYGIPYVRIEDISIKGTLSQVLVRNTKTYVSACYTRENERLFGLVLDALLEELYELNKSIQKIENIEYLEQLKLPFPINKEEGKILDMFVNPLRVQEKNKWNQWTKGMRYMMIDFKHLLTISALNDPYL